MMLYFCDLIFYQILSVWCLVFVELMRYNESIH